MGQRIWTFLGVSVQLQRLVLNLKVNQIIISLQIITFTSISCGFVSSKIYDKCGDFDFNRVKFPFLDGDVPSRTWGYI